MFRKLEQKARPTVKKVGKEAERIGKQIRDEARVIEQDTRLSRKDFSKELRRAWYDAGPMAEALEKGIRHTFKQHNLNKELQEAGPGTWGLTKLHVAALNNNRAEVENLLREGASPNVTTAYGNVTALHLMLQPWRRLPDAPILSAEDRLFMINLLLHYGADPRLTVEWNNQTPLQMAEENARSGFDYDSGTWTYYPARDIDNDPIVKRLREALAPAPVFTPARDTQQKNNAATSDAPEPVRAPSPRPTPTGTAYTSFE